MYAMYAINTVRTHAQTHANSCAYVQDGKGVFDHKYIYREREREREREKESTRAHV